VTILLWLLPAALVTLGAMVLVSWVGRERPERERTDAEHARFAAAILKPLPKNAARPRGVERRREPSTGVAVRRTDARKSA
jgi:hypothetical protein